MMGVVGLGSLGACANPVVVEPIPDGGARTDGGVDGSPTGTGLWAATPAAGAALFSEGPSVDKGRQWKRDPHYFKDSANTQYLFISGSPYSTESWSVSYYTQSSGTISNASTWTSALVGTAGTWYSGDITGPAIRYTTTEKTLFFAANALPADLNKTRPDYVFQIGRAPFDTGTFRPSAAPVLSVPTFNGTDVSSTPTTARPDAYGVMDPWILDDNAGSTVTMYYTGLDCASATCRFQIFRTVSTDGGLTFPPGNVVLSGRTNNPEEAGGVATPSVLLLNGKYVLAYTAVATPPTKSRTAIRASLSTGSIDVAVSTDGINFTNASATGAPVIQRGTGYREQGASSPSLYLDATNALHSYFAGFQSSNGADSYNLATADWYQN